MTQFKHKTTYLIAQCLVDIPRFTKILYTSTKARAIYSHPFTAVGLILHGCFRKPFPLLFILTEVLRERCVKKKKVCVGKGGGGGGGCGREKQHPCIAHKLTGLSKVKVSIFYSFFSVGPVSF